MASASISLPTYSPPVASKSQWRLATSKAGFLAGEPLIGIGTPVQLLMVSSEPSIFLSMTLIFSL